MKEPTMSAKLLPIVEAKATEAATELKTALATFGEDDSVTLFWAEQAQRWQRLESYLGERVGR